MVLGRAGALQVLGAFRVARAVLHREQAVMVVLPAVTHLAVVVVRAVIGLSWQAAAAAAAPLVGAMQELVAMVVPQLVPRQVLAAAVAVVVVTVLRAVVVPMP